jgi:hypothetical protein
MHGMKVYAKFGNREQTDMTVVISARIVERDLVLSPSADAIAFLPGQRPPDALDLLGGAIKVPSPGDIPS